MSWVPIFDSYVDAPSPLVGWNKKVGSDPYIYWWWCRYIRDLNSASKVKKVSLLLEVDDPPHLGVVAQLEKINQTSGPDGLCKCHLIIGAAWWKRSLKFVSVLVDWYGFLHVASLLGNGILRLSLQNPRDVFGSESDIMIHDSLLIESTDCLCEKNGFEKSEQPELGALAYSGVFLGVIDDEFPVGRIIQRSIPDFDVCFWDQGSVPVRPRSYARADIAQRIARANGSLAVAGHGFSYGLELVASPPAVSTTTVYGCSFLEREGHGASVLSLIAPWLSGYSKSIDKPADIQGLAMVQLPSRTVYDTSGGALAGRVIDGIRYILHAEQVSRPENGPPRNTLVNLSYGLQAGAHDGTSMLECAMREMLDAAPYLCIVLPAGNSGRSGCHTRRVLNANDQANNQAMAQPIIMRLLPDNPKETFVEFWFDRGSDIRLHIKPPPGTASSTLIPGQARTSYDAKGRLAFVAVHTESPAQSLNRSMILLAISPTSSSHLASGLSGGAEAIATPGVWEFEVENLGPNQLFLDAWIERDTPPAFSDTGLRQAYFPDSCQPSLRTNNVEPENSINSFATFIHKRLTIVGAMRANGRLVEYSGAGDFSPRGKRAGPDSVTVGDYSRHIEGLRTSGWADGAVTRMNGTSASAAVFTRDLAKKLCAPAVGLATPAAQPKTPTEFVDGPEHAPVARVGPRGFVRRQITPYAVDTAPDPYQP